MAVHVRIDNPGRSISPGSGSLKQIITMRLESKEANHQSTLAAYEFTSIDANGSFQRAGTSLILHQKIFHHRYTSASI